MALALLLSVIVVVIMLSFGGYKETAEAAQQLKMAEYMEMLSRRNVDVIFYKTDPIGPENLKARRVNALNDQGLALNLYSDRAFHVMILDDLDGSLLLSDQDIRELRELLTNQHFRIVYLGTAHYNQLVQGEILTKSSNHMDGTNTYLAYYNERNMKSSVEGDAFAARNPYALNIDYKEEPPMYDLGGQHRVASWLVDPRAPKVELPPELVEKLEKMKKEAEIYE